MWRINEFCGLTKTDLLQERGCVYGVVPMNYRALNYCCNAELYDLIEYNACTIQNNSNFIPNSNTKTARQTAVKSPNDGRF